MMKMKIFLSAIFVFSLLFNNVHGRPVKAIALPVVCGLRLVQENPFGSYWSRIIGGKNASPGSWPWQISLQQPLDYEGLDYAHSCGGFIIDPHWVMTAAHCFKGIGNDYKDWIIVLGAHQLSKLTPETQIRKIAKKIAHIEYNPNTEKNDIALLLMDRPVSFSNYIQPACLPRKDTVIESLTECFISGWGVTSEDGGEPVDILQEAKVELINVKTCNSTSWYNGAVGKYNLCAGYERGGVDSCQGDSGGPLMCRKPQTKAFTVVGITSWGYGCAQVRSPGIYSSTQYFLDWILQNMAMFS